MRRDHRGVLGIGLAALSAAALSLGVARAGARGEALARQILRATGVRGGLVVHLGCGDGSLTAALHASDSYLVHGLDTDAAKVAAGRERIRTRGLYGSVALETFDGEALPYADNLVNLLVAEGLGKVPVAEVMRALCPNGVAYVKANGRWTTTVKPRPEAIDEWTHYLHGPDNNAVAQDRVVASPHHVQWVGEPKYARSHEFLTSVTAMVSGGGRLFAIADEGSTALHRFLPARWSLIARDAFNGVLLWKRRLASWQPFSQRGRIPFPPDLHRRLVAAGDRVYTTLSIFAPVTALDAATGRTLRTYANTEKCEEILLDGGVLYCVLGLAGPSAVDRRKLADQRAEPDRKRLLAIRAATGDVLWSKHDADMAGLFHLTLAIGGGQLVFANARQIVCLDAASGKVRWRHDRPNKYARSAWSTPTLVVHGGVVLCADRLPSAPDVPKTRVVNAELVALSAESGEKLWTRPCAEGVREPADVFVIHGTVWLGQQPSRRAADFRTGYDLRTGKVREKFTSTEGWAGWHHHRCYREKATSRYILAGRTGVEFIDLRTGEIAPHHWIRGICRYGVLPCNGLLYAPPDQCACYIQSRLCGFHALAPASAKATAGRPTAPRLERGPAYGQTPSPRSAIRNGDWPTYRHDAARSGCTASAVGLDLTPRWSATLGGKLTTLVSAGGRVFVCQADAHTVVCLDAGSGKVLWRYTAGGRVDSPPTIARSMAVFGSRDGCVYALRASDGQLVWRFRAAPHDRRLVAYDQVESVWPVHGSTLVEGGAVYVAAGRNSYVDGGVWLHKLELATGKPLLSRRYSSRDPKTGQRVDLFKPFRGEMQPEQDMPGLQPDVFSADGQSLYLRSVALTRGLDVVGLGKPHLFCSMGLLDDASWERTYWLFGRHMYSGCIGWQYARTLAPAGRMMAFDDQQVYYHQDATFRRPGLYAAAREPERIPPPPEKTPAGKKPKKKRRYHNWSRMKFAPAWRQDIPLNARAMVLTGDRLFIAGPPRFDERAAYTHLRACRTDESTLSPLLADAVAAFEGRKGCLLWVADKSDGKKLAELKLDSLPVFDGMIAADGKLYMATADGKVVCLAGKP